jgi:HPt (histidine-containing phosphotransfer) domain-containing protein
VQYRELANIVPSQTAMQSLIDELLLSGRATTMAEAENMFLDAHLSEIAELAERLTEEEFGRHELVRLLLAHGSRPWEDSLL